MDPGTALAVVSLTFDVFAGCIKGFNLIAEARNLGRDAPLERTKLLLQEYRLIEWAKAVRLDSPEARVVEELNQNLAALLLVQLEQTLSSVDRLKQRYCLDAIVQDQHALSLEQAAPTTGQPEDSTSVLARIISPKTRKEIMDRSAKVKSSNAFPKRLWFAAVDKQKLSMLVLDVTSMVDGLWMLLDTATKVRITRTIGRDLALVLSSCENADSLKQLQSVLEPGGSETGLSDTLAASAGVKAAILATMTKAGSSNKGSLEKMSRDEGLLLDSARIRQVREIPSTQLTMGQLDQQPVLIEDKHVQQHKVKSKLQTRVIELASLLSKSSSPTLMTLPCLGYTIESFGYRLVFRIASPSAAISAQRAEPTTLLALLSDPKTLLPSVDVRLRLALQISKTVLTFHAAGWLHKDIRSANIILPGNTSLTPQSNPVLTGFSFARRDRPTEYSDSISTNPQMDIYRHPKAMGDDYEGFQRHMDAYALGCVLVEIAEWAPLRKIVRKCVDISRSVHESEIAALAAWLRVRYVGSGGMAGFRLGGAFEALVDLCFPEDGREVELVEFLDSLEDLGRCRVEQTRIVTDSSVKSS